MEKDNSKAAENELFSAKLLGGSKLVDCSQMIQPGCFSYVSCFYKNGEYNKESIVDSRTEEKEKFGYIKESMKTALDVGTHIDSPMHFFLDGRSIDELKLSELICPGVVIDVSKKCIENPEYLLTIEDIKEWETKYGEIPKRALVSMKTGKGAKFNNIKEYIGTDNPLKEKSIFPGFSVEAAQYLLEKVSEVVAIGIDTASLDVSSTIDFPVHRLWLGSGRYMVENMNLESVPESGLKFVLLPLNIKGAVECTTRVLAVID